MATPQIDGKTDLSEYILGDSAHYPHFEQPEEYAGVIEEFCSRVEAQRSESVKK